MFVPVDVAMLAITIWLVADSVPSLKVEGFCRAIAERAAPFADMERCLRKEQETRAQLMHTWAQFHPADRAHCVGLMTAVPIRRLIALREQAEGLWVEGYFTAGVTNAVRAGDSIGTEQEYGPGTINMVLVTNARLTRSAMVCAVQVVTEAKTAALFRANVHCSRGKAGATGTGTDATVIVCGDGPSLKFSGTHTMIGMILGRLVLRGLQKGLRP